MERGGANLCNGTISASLAAMHEQLKQAISRQSRLGSDESSLKNNGKKNWITARFQTIEVADGSQYNLSQDYFRFMFEPGVEPTNNHSEQQVRHCVIDRRITQGTRSEVGQRYHERMWTAIATCGKQGRSFFHFLHESVAAGLSGGEPPRLLPE